MHCDVYSCVYIYFDVGWKESEIVLFDSEHVWISIVPNILLLLGIWQTCCFSLQWLLFLFCPVVLMSLGGVHNNRVYDIWWQWATFFAFYTQFGHVRITITTTPVFVILLSTLELDGFFWNRTGMRFSCKCCHKIMSIASKAHIHTHTHI